MFFKGALVIYFITAYSSFCYGNENNQHRANSSTNVTIEDIIQKVTNLTLQNTYNVPAKNKTFVIRKMQKKLEELSKSKKIDKKYMDILMTGIQAKVSDIYKNEVSEVNVTNSHIPTYSNKKTFSTKISSSNDMIQGNLNKSDVVKYINLLIAKYLSLVNKTDDKLDFLNNIKEKILVSNFDATTDKDSRRMKWDNKINDAIRIMDGWDELNTKVTVSKSVGSAFDDCDKIVETICFRIKELRMFTCHSSEVISLVKLCDLEQDCEDHSDETNCNVNVLEVVETALHLINKINRTVTSKCFSKSAVRSFVSTHATFLIEELESNTDALKQLEIEALFEKSPDTSSKIVYLDYTKVISSLSLAIEQAICMDDDNPLVEPEFAIEEFQEISDAEVSPKSCICKNEKCLNANCDIGSPCGRICIQKHILKNWGCLSSDKRISVKLDVVCDGKIDCIDASDEESCSSDTRRSRYQAIKFYNTVLSIILERTKLTKHKANRNNLYLLHGMVREMQKLAVKPSIDPRIVKKQRENIFNMIGQIFENTIQRASLPVVESTYQFLVLVNVKLVEAMKQSHTGNVASFSLDACVCKNGDCTLRRCSKNCIRTCLVEPTLMRYPCSEPNGNVSVALNALCNGYNNCFNGEDEKGCMKGKPLKIVDLLIKYCLWKDATETLHEAENQKKLTPSVFAEKLQSLLKELVQAYGTMDDHKQYGDYVLKEFEKVAHIIMNALKTCGK